MSVSWFWSGGQTEQSIKVTAKLNASAASCRLQLSLNGGMTSPFYSSSVAPDSNLYVRLQATGLSPSTTYFYRLEIDGVVDTSLTGEFTTFPTPGDPFSFTFASATCSSSGSNSKVFANIAAKRPLIFQHVGDKHYQNIGSDDPDAFHAAYNMGFTVNQTAFHSVVPMSYTWDDHDFGGNGSYGFSAARQAANDVYRQVVPSHGLPNDYGIYHTYDIGLIRFIVTDLRTFRSPTSQDDGRHKTMMGPTQKEWFKDLVALSAEDGTGAIVWANSSQWTIEENWSGAIDPNDTWRTYAYERAELARFMRKVGCPPIVIVSGDAHELAARLDYRIGGMRFAVYQNAALDASQNTRGDYWDYGPVGGGGHYGMLTFDDNGDDVLTLRWEGYEMYSTSSGAERVLFDSTIDLTERLILPVAPFHHDRRRSAAA
jgi:phosphodiesterase/alkaline phosphatase D-like protein